MELGKFTSGFVSRKDCVLSATLLKVSLWHSSKRLISSIDSLQKISTQELSRGFAHNIHLQKANDCVDSSLVTAEVVQEFF